MSTTRPSGAVHVSRRTVYRADWKASLPSGQEGQKAKDTPQLEVSRPNFIELCVKLTVEDEKVFEHLWRYLGLSVDWSMTYATIAPASQRVSQKMFLRLLKKGLAYQVEAPTLWDVDFRTAVAQAELEDREQPGAYHRIRFARQDRPGADRKSTRLNSSHKSQSRMPSSA